MKGHRLLILSAVLATAGCESDEAKYDRLSRELAVASLAVRGDELARERGEPVCPDLSKLPTNQYLSACNARVAEHDRKLALAQREMNKFMNR